MVIRAKTSAIFYRSVLLAALSSVSLWWILLHQGWKLPDQKVFFRPPMHHDVERHLILVNAYLRESGSPFLATTKVAYQTVWHRVVAEVVRPFNDHLEYSEFRWVLLASGFLFIFCLVFLLARLRPSLLLQKRGFWILFALVGLHADIFGFCASLFFNHQFGIEADWSFKGPLIFRNISIPLLALTSPQHCLFLITALLLLSLRRTRFKGVVSGILFVLSPPLAVLFCIPYFLWRLSKKKGMLLELILCCSLGWVVFNYIYGYSLMEFFGRPGTLQLTWFPDWLAHWTNLPFILIGILGGTGLFITLMLSLKLVKSRNRHILFWILGIAFLFYNVVTDIELRRHVSILLSVLSLFFIAKSWPILNRTLFSRFTKSAVNIGFGVLILLHGYFVYSFTMKPSVVSNSIVWNDYLEMNHLIRKNYPGMKVLAAISPKELGLNFPLVMEATTSFATPLDASVHSLLNERQVRQMVSLSQGESLLKHARELGYNGFIWGPVESLTWGESGKKSFGDFKSMGIVGKVELYLLETKSERPNQLNN